MTLTVAPATDTGLMSGRRVAVLALAGVTAATEAAAVAGFLPDLPVGGLDLSISLLPALVLAAVCGTRLLGRSASRRSAFLFWATMAVLGVALAAAYARDGRFDLFPALVSAALGEELVYRLAIPAVIAAALRLGAVRPVPARVAGFGGAALWFVLLPGHQDQISSAAGVLPFLAFAALSAFVVYRSGSVLPMAAVHAVSNLLTVLMWREAVPADSRSVGLACALSLLVLAYGRPRRITLGDDGGLVDTVTGLRVTGIDLRDGRPAAVVLSDGQELPVSADAIRPDHVAVVESVDAADAVPPTLTD